SEVTRARIERAIVVITKITTGDHSIRADPRQRARLGAAQRVLPIAVVDEFPVGPTWEIQIARERLARSDRLFARVAFVVVRFPRGAWTPPERPGLVIPMPIVVFVPCRQGVVIA
ncbi:MAG TPA: hypothetical protein VH138_04610, partial [Vicinamibacterales bacterium]|nr:hypothetical protein [Vicinamibacterales bacterium]